MQEQSLLYHHKAVQRNQGRAKKIEQEWQQDMGRYHEYPILALIRTGQQSYKIIFRCFLRSVNSSREYSMNTPVLFF